MNTKLSGCQLVLVDIKRLGRNYFPFVENIRSRLIKFIDFYATSYLPDTDAPGVTTSADMYMTLYNEYGQEELHRDIPLKRFDYTQTLGVRMPVYSKLGMQSCYIDCQNAAMVGKTMALVFWYDLPEYSARNTSDMVVTDAISIPLISASRYNPLPDTDRLTGKRFRRLLLGTPTTTPDFQTGLTMSECANVYLTLRKGTYNILENCPLPILYQLQMIERSEFQNIIFDFQNSFLTIGGAGTIPNVKNDYIGKSVFLNLQYEAK